jgi:hypothetical protein
MGKTFLKNPKRFDDEIPGQRSGKNSKHSNGKKTGGMKTLNSYVEEDYDDPFEDEFEIKDEIFIKHTKQNDDTN